MHQNSESIINLLSFTEEHSSLPLVHKMYEVKGFLVYNYLWTFIIVGLSELFLFQDEPGRVKWGKYLDLNSRVLHFDLPSPSTAPTPPRRTETGTRLWTWSKTETPTSRTCCVETPPCWTQPRKAAWHECRSCAAQTTLTAATRRDATPPPCTSQVRHQTLLHT